MIIDNTYFKGEIYIPHAKPGISDDVVGIDSEVISFINEYAKDCLFKCLGPQLYADLELNLDSNEASWIDALADQKWDDLVNGKSYTDPSSNLDVVWKGIRYINIFGGTEYDRSFLANYVYFYHEKKEYVTRSGVGHETEKAHNAEAVTPTNKVVNAWNKFVELVQGVEDKKIFVKEYFGTGIDFYQNNEGVSLYKFINDSNKISDGTYANFKPKSWKKMNQFNL
jgi:hypothetical protein